jgi:hypothetical protein
VVSKEDITRTPLCLKSRIVRSLYASLSLDFLIRTCAACVVRAAVSAPVQPDPCGTVANQPGDVSLQLSLKNRQAIFREGEIIALTAEYSSPSEKKYYLNTRGYDRSGRLDGMEVFCIDPDTGEDPLSDYFNGEMGFIGGGLRGEQDLSRKLYPINLELNEEVVATRVVSAMHCEPSRNRSDTTIRMEWALRLSRCDPTQSSFR